MYVCMYILSMLICHQPIGQCACAYRCKCMPPKSSARCARPQMLCILLVLIISSQLLIFFIFTYPGHPMRSIPLVAECISAPRGRSISQPMNTYILMWCHVSVMSLHVVLLNFLGATNTVTTTTSTRH